MTPPTVCLADWADWEPTVYHLSNEVFDMEVPALVCGGLVIHLNGAHFHLRHYASGALMAKASAPTSLRELAAYLSGYVDFTAFDSPMGYHNLCPNLPNILIAAAPTFHAEATVVDKNTAVAEQAHRAVAHKHRGAVA